MRPFSNGSEYRFWLSKNCEQCKKNVEVHGDEYTAHCEIEEALAIAAVTDGHIAQDIYKRMGDPLKFDCPEIERL